MPLRFVSFLLLLLCMLLSADPRSAHAQMKVGFGAKIGANLGIVGGDMETMMLNASVFGDDVKENPRTGIVAGGFAVIDFGGAFSIQTEASYVQKGQTVEFTPLLPPGPSGISTFNRRSERAKMSLRFSYIEIPVLARYRFAPDDEEGVYPHVFAGPTFGFNLTSNVEVESDPYDRAETQTISSETNDREFGLTVGVGAELDLTGGRAIIDARLGVGLDRIYSGTLGAYRHRSLALTVGFFF